MAMNKNINEAGWFYHSPARRRDAEPVYYPPASQIPGLTEDDGSPDDPIRPLFKDTDTKYVRLAKQGGRQNLLYMKENSSQKKDAVGYPKNEWFYLADNQMEDEAEKRANEIEYDFLRPEYMVHQPYKREHGVTFQEPRRRNLLSHDKMSVFEREPCGSATDKTVKLPELTKPGFGIRAGKPLRIPKTTKADRNKPQSANTDPGRGPRQPKYLSLPTDGADSDKPNISKIMSYDYERQWQDQLSNWQEKQDIGKSRHRQMTNPPGCDTMQSEYTNNYAKSSAVHSGVEQRQPEDTARYSDKSSRRSDKSGYSGVRINEAQRLREAQLIKPTEKEMFKMTKFKNVASRTESHRPSQTQQAC